jgi:hypothetical protein
MNALEQLTELMRKERRNELYPFLQGLDDATKKELTPGLKKLDAEYFKFEPISHKNGGTQYGYKSSDSQREMLSITFFVCFNQKDFDQAHTGGILKKELLGTILPWYCPIWFNKHINAYADRDFVPYFLDYDWYMELVEQGYVEPSVRLIARILPNAIYTPNIRSRVYSPELLLKRPVTLQEHIWYVFEHETVIHQDYNKEEYWLKTFTSFEKENKIPREKLLKETLSASNRNFNQNLSGWFMELFIRLNPNTAELLTLQPQLFSVLSAPHTRPVNTVLKYFKELASDNAFDKQSFVDHSPILLSSESKTAVSNALMILEKLAKKDASLHKETALLASQALIHQDEGTQLRAAKLILKYGDTADLDLWEAVSTYRQGLLFTARELLSPFLVEDISDETIEESITEVKADIAPIVFPASFDELVYLASQAFDQNEIYHFDLLPAALLKFQSEMNAENIRKLLPAFQRAYKTLTDDWTSTRGYLDHMLATFFTDFGRLLINFYPDDAKPVKELYDSIYQKLAEKKQDYKIGQLSSTIKKWDLFSHSHGYKPHKHILLNAYFLLERKIELPLLSTPTHEPALVAVETLIERLVQYQNARTTPGLMDYQVAMMRCFIEDRSSALALADRLLQGERRQLTGFMLGEDHQPDPVHQLHAVWLATALTHRPETAEQWLGYSKVSPAFLLKRFTWVSKIEHFEYKRYNFQLKQDEMIADTRTAVFVHLNKEPTDTATTLTGIKTLWNKFFGSKQTDTYEPGYFDFIELKYKYLNSEHNDIRRQLTLQPYDPEYWLGFINQKAFRYFDFTGENDKRLVIYTLETLLNLRFTFGPMTHLLIGTTLLSNDKTARTYAAELWIKGVRENVADSSLLGGIIGQHEREGLAPLKRLTDIIISNMLGVSATHNAGLEYMLRSMLRQLPIKPPANTRKLLEVYLEVLAANKSKEQDMVVLKLLNEWSQQSDTLKTAAEKVTRLK